MAKSIKLGSDTFLSITGLDGLVADALPSNANWNDYIGTHNNKIYYIADSSGQTNAAGSWGFMISLSYGSIHTQVFFPYNGASIKIRGANGTSWGNWRSVALS